MSNNSADLWWIAPSSEVLAACAFAQHALFLLAFPGLVAANFGFWFLLYLSPPPHFLAKETLEGYFLCVFLLKLRLSEVSK